MFHSHKVFNQLNRLVNSEHAGVDAQVISRCLSPFFVRIEIVISRTGLVFFSDALLRLRVRQIVFALGKADPVLVIRA